MTVNLAFGGDAEIAVQELMVNLQKIAEDHGKIVDPSDIEALARMLVALPDGQIQRIKYEAFVLAALEVLQKYPRNMGVIGTLQEQILSLYEVK